MYASRSHERASGVTERCSWCKFNKKKNIPHCSLLDVVSCLGAGYHINLVARNLIDLDFIDASLATGENRLQGYLGSTSAEKVSTPF